MSQCTGRLTLKVSQTQVDVKELTTKVTVKPKNTNLKVTDEKTKAVEVRVKSVGLNISIPGVQGPKGDRGDTAQIEFTKLSSGVLSAIKAVRSVDADHVTEATSNQTYQNAEVLGITKTAASAPNQSVVIITFGEIEDNFFSGFSINEPVFLGLNGVLTQTPPNTGFLKEIGYCNGVNSIFVNLKRTIEL